MFTFWHRWLQASFVVFALIGLDLAFFSGSAAFRPLTEPIAEHFFGAGADQLPGLEGFQRFAYGVMGALTAGWSLSGFLVARYGVARRQAWCWWTLVVGLDLWYLVDTGISAYHGVTVNVIGNTVYLLVLAVPLGALYGHMGDRGERAAPDGRVKHHAPA